MAAATLVQSFIQTRVKTTGNSDDVGDNNTSEHPWSVHFVVMTHMKYLTVLSKKKKKKNLAHGVAVNRARAVESAQAGARSLLCHERVQ